MAELQASNGNNMAGKVALGVTTIAITAGAVALGLALTSKKNRAALKKGTQGLAKKAQGIRKAIENGRERVQVFAHRISSNRKARKALRETAKAVKRGRPRLISA